MFTKYITENSILKLSCLDYSTSPFQKLPKPALPPQCFQWPPHRQKGSWWVPAPSTAFIPAMLSTTPCYHLPLQHTMSTPPQEQSSPPWRPLTAEVLPLLPHSHFTSGLPHPGHLHISSPSLPSPRLKNFPVKSKEHSTLPPHHSPTFSLQIFHLSVSQAAHSCPSSPGRNGSHSSAVLTWPSGEGPLLPHLCAPSAAAAPPRPDLSLWPPLL